VGPASRVPFIGLTGGMGAGKSEALSALGELGAATLSTDAVVHELLGTDELRDALVERFGEDIAPDGVVDRSKVGERVFSDPGERGWLEEQLWPRVGRRVAEWREETAGEKAAVVEVPLLFEAGMEEAFDHTLAVVADEDVRERRAADRGHAGVASRHDRQLPQEEKAQRADFVVRNDGTREELKKALSRVLEKIGT
jgi:dephospho-CoA kinase